MILIPLILIKVTEVLLRQETERSQRLAEHLRQTGINPDQLD
ncbi:MAG: hypothetical protein RSE13_11525 [Planktothrix sp. GU0601_MAG3]|nr:MAG: hypothetical protein RSE13_11525 [Planktothrix sp. GU0601_MAG3]